MKKLSVMLSVALSVFVLNAGECFKAGFSRLDITPPLGTPMAGYYAYRPSTGVLDPLEVICIAVSDGENTALLYSFDLLYLSNPMAERIRETVSRETGIAADAIYLASTHTHLGPYLAPGGEVLSQKEAEIARAKAAIEFSNAIIVSRAVDSAKYAIADLTDSGLAIARGEAKGLSFVRRFRMKDGSTRTNPGVKNPEIDGPLGTPDESVQLVRFTREGRPDIAIINFQTHPDVIGGTRYSADWPGFARRQFEKALEGEVFAAVFNGAQGDTNHINVRPSGDVLALRRYDHARFMGRRLAGAALGIWDVAKPVEAGKVGWKTSKVTIPAKKVDPAKVPRYREIAKLHREHRDREIKETGMERTTVIAEAISSLYLVDNDVKSYEMPVSTVTIGRTIAFCGFPGEPFTDMGRDVKKSSAFTMTVPTCCTGGSFGYMPMASAYDEGGYEQRSSRYAKGVAELLVGGGLSALDELYRAAGK